MACLKKRKPFSGKAGDNESIAISLSAMTQLSEPRRTRIASPSPIDSEEAQRERERQRALREHCRPFFERLCPSLIETHPNWFIAIDPDNEEYLLAPTLREITKQIRQAYKPNKIRMIFRLNNTGSCGRLWV
jgi:5-formyltetrahydrofolate cyclo-ligase